MTSTRGDVGARRLWLPWRPRCRLILSYPRHWHWVLVQLNRFDLWYSHRIEGRRFRGLWIAVVFPLFVMVRFLGLVAVLEITIIAFAASIYLVWGEWFALWLSFPFVLLARLAHVLPWRLMAHDGQRRWTARVSGWIASRNERTAARDALAAGREPPAMSWTETPRRSRVWM